MNVLIFRVVLWSFGCVRFGRGVVGFDQSWRNEIVDDRRLKLNRGPQSKCEAFEISYYSLSIERDAKGVWTRL
ncbi:unnamed protein product [Allacma fusca]|uniref:Secreted protein n=1 Tax=Allacma fusca TaxID=39272 RepID=A0A8J2P0I3_9HEXA|nr:unnamed protein product [Allacma fusca]